MSTSIDSHIIEALRSFPSNTAQAISKDLIKVNQLLSIDSEMAVVRIRKAIDIIVRSACKMTDIEPGSKPLDNLLSDLKKSGVLPDVIDKHCRIVKDFGNIAVHDFDNHSFENESYELSSLEAEQCLRSLDIISRWYVDKILPKQKDDYPFVVINGKEIDPRILIETAAIDSYVYPSDFRATPEIILKWFKRNPDIYTLLVDKGTNKVIGYINAMPLDDEYYEKIKKGDMLDITLPAEAIRTYDFPDFYRIYFASIAIDPSYHTTKAFRILYDAFIDKLFYLARNDIYISEIAADAITKEGERIAVFAGMKKLIDTNHNSSFYHVTLLPPALRVTTSKGKSLLLFYQKKYLEFKDLFKFSPSTDS